METTAFGPTAVEGGLSARRRGAGTYTCFAPEFIFRSCLINLMMHLRSLAVHLGVGRVQLGLRGALKPRTLLSP